MRVERFVWAAVLGILLLSVGVVGFLQIGGDKEVDPHIEEKQADAARVRQVDVWCKEDFYGKKDDGWDRPEPENVHCQSRSEDAMVYHALAELRSNLSSVAVGSCTGISGKLMRVNDEWWLTRAMPHETRIRVRVTAWNTSHPLLNSCDGEHVLLVGVLREGDLSSRLDFYPTRVYRVAPN